MKPLSRCRVGVLIDQEVLVPGTSRLQPKAVDRFPIAAVRRLAEVVAVEPYTTAEALIAWVKRFQPDIVLNLTEHADGQRHKDVCIVAVLELLGVSFTGTTISGLMLCRDKAQSKYVARSVGFRVPWFFLLDRKMPRVPEDCPYPLLVKPRFGDSSEGLTLQSIVHSKGSLLRRAKALATEYPEGLICEEFVEGREIRIALLGTRVLSPLEFIVGRGGRGAPRFMSYRAKHDSKYRRRWRIGYKPAALSVRQTQELGELCQRASHALRINSYAHFDVRLTPAGEWVFLEGNPNPGLDPFGVWSSIPYDHLMTKILLSALAR